MKKIEIEVPEGYVAKEEKTENGINIIFVKEDKEKEMKEFLREKLNGCSIRLVEKYPDLVFYEKDGKTLFELYQDRENKNKLYFWVDYNSIWSIFETKYGMKYADIQAFIKNEVEMILKLGSVTPYGKIFRSITRWK